MNIPLKRKIKFYLLALLFIAIDCTLPLLPKAVASADSPAPSGTFQYAKGNATITGPTNCNSGSVNVTYKKIGSNGIYEYTMPPTSDTSCSTDIQTSSKKYDGSTGGTYSGKQIVSKNGGNKTTNFGGKNTKISITKAGSNASGTGSTTTYGHWVDVSTITVNGQTYFDDQIDDNLTFKLQGGDDCTGKSMIDGFNGSASNGGNATTTAKLHIYQIAGNGDNSCVEQVKGGEDIDFLDTSNYLKYFTWDDSGTLSTSDESGIIFTQDSTNKKLFMDDGSGRSGDSKCQSQITIGSDPTQGTLILRYSGDRKLSSGWQSDIAKAKLAQSGACKVSGKIPITIANPIDPASGNAANTLAAGSSNLSGGNGSASGSCESKGGPIGWIMCAVIDTLADAVNGIYTLFIVPMLQTPSLTSGSTQGDNLFKAWSSFRVFGNIFLVIVILIVIFGESIGGGAIDAYTIKKILPRILTAAIMINLSYYGVSLFIDFSNIIGNGIRLLITGAFGLQDNGFNLKAVNGSAQAGFLGISGAGIGLLIVGIDGAAIVAGFITIIFTILPMLALLLLAIMAVLALRIGILYALVIASPVACALWVLPNTEKYFKKWFELLQTTAMVFPIISALFGLSMVLAQTTLWANGSKGALGGVVGYVLSLIIVVMPLVLIPFAFKLAGGLLGRAYELANNGRSMGNSYLKKRGELRKERMGKGTFFNPQSRFGGSALGQRMNSSLERNAARAANENDEARGTRFALSRGARESRREGLNTLTLNKHQRHVEDAAKQIDASYGGNEHVTQAAQRAYDDQGRFSADRMRQNLEAYTNDDGSRKYDEAYIRGSISKVQQIRGQQGDTTFRMASALSYLNNGTVDDTANVEAIQWLNKATHGDRQALINTSLAAAEHAKAAGRVDLFSSSPSQNIEFIDKVVALGDVDATTSPDALRVSNEILAKAYETRSPGEMAMAKGDAINRFAPLIVQKVDEQQRQVVASVEYQAERATMRGVDASSQAVAVARSQVAAATKAVEDARAQVTFGGTATPDQQDTINIAIQAQEAATQQLQATQTGYEANVNVHKSRRQALESTDAHRELMHQLARAKGLEDIAAQIPDGKAKAYVETTFASGTVVNTDANGNPEYGTLSSLYNRSDVTSNETFRQYHREYSDAESLRSVAYQAAASAAAGATGTPPGGPPLGPPSTP